MRLYKEISAEPPSFPTPSPPKPTKGVKDQAGAKGKGPKGRGKKAKKQGGLGGSLVAPPAEPSWELLASSTDELQAVGEDLTGQAANAEADIGYQVRLHLNFSTVCLYDNRQLHGACGTKYPTQKWCLHPLCWRRCYTHHLALSGWVRIGAKI